MSNSIIYEGTVTTKIVSHNEVVKTIKSHNTGTPNLFRLIANALVGYPVSSQIPQYIVAYNKSTPTSDDFERSTPAIPITASYVNVSQDGQSYSAAFTATLPRADILSPNGKKLLSQYALYNSRNISSDIYKLATLDLQTPINLENMDMGQNIIIEWKMKFQNSPEQPTSRSSQTSQEGTAEQSVEASETLEEETVSQEQGDQQGE